LDLLGDAIEARRIVCHDDRDVVFRVEVDKIPAIVLIVGDASIIRRDQSR